MDGATGESNCEVQEASTAGIDTYRSIRLLNDLHNITFGSLFVPLGKSELLLILFITTYATFKLRSFMSSMVFGFILIYMIDVLLLALTSALIMSKVFNLSSKFRIQQAKKLKLIPPIRRMDLQRQLESFPTLKCQVGPFYHMEGKAKLTMLDTMTRGVAFMLLSFN